MDFDLSDEQRLLQESTATFLSRECPTAKVRELMGTETAFDEKLWALMAEQGYQGLLLADKYEGLELGLVELAIISEEMGRSCLPGPFLSNLWGTCLIDRSGSDAIKDKHLKNIASGKTKVTVACLEADGDWDTEFIKLKAKESGKAYVLNGEKHYVMDAGASDYIIVAARVSSGQLLLVLVPSDSTGLTLTRVQSMDPTRPLYRIELKNVTAGASDVLALGDKADQAWLYAKSVATVAASADMVGGMQWTMDTSVEYAKTRKQFDSPIGIFQAIQHKCADMMLDVESSRSSVYYAAWSLGEGEDDSQRAVSMAKTYCSNASHKIGGNGIQIHGGIGMTWEHDLHLFYKRSKASEQLFGDATFHREQIARIMISR